MLLVDYSAQLMHSRLIIIKPNCPNWLYSTRNVLPFPNFMDLVQLEVLMLGLGGFWTVLGIYFSPRATPTHPCAHTCLPHLHICSNMPHPCSHMHSWPFWMIRRLISPPRGAWGSNLMMTLVWFHIPSKASQIFPIVLYISSKNIYMLDSLNNIHYWLHVLL